MKTIKQIPILLDGQIDDQTLYLESIRFIAKNRELILEDGELDWEVETLFQLQDGKFLVRTDKRLVLNLPGVNIGKNVRTHMYRREPNPTVWLLTHGHERLAAFMFPEYKDAVESDCTFNYKDARKYKGETLYGTGETKGETFRGKPPL